MKIQVTINGESRLVPIKEVPKLESGEPLTVLLDSKTDGVYNVDTVHYETEAINKAKIESKISKEEALSKLTVTTSSGKVFYADTESRVDLNDAIRKAEKDNILTTPWKLAEDFNGQRIVVVTLDEIREAADLALVTKGSIVGAVNENG